MWVMEAEMEWEMKGKMKTNIREERLLTSLEENQMGKILSQNAAKT